MRLSSSVGVGASGDGVLQVQSVPHPEPVRHDRCEGSDPQDGPQLHPQWMVASVEVGQAAGVLAFAQQEHPPHEQPARAPAGIESISAATSAARLANRDSSSPRIACLLQRTEDRSFFKNTTDHPLGETIWIAAKRGS